MRWAGGGGSVCKGRGSQMGRVPGESRAVSLACTLSGRVEVKAVFVSGGQSGRPGGLERGARSGGHMRETPGSCMRRSMLVRLQRERAGGQVRLEPRILPGAMLGKTGPAPRGSSDSGSRREGHGAWSPSLSQLGAS